MSETSVDFQTSFLSDGGVFVNDKGAYAYKQFENLAFWVIADGLELNETKESAKLAVEQLCIDFTRNPTLKRNLIRKYLVNAHNRLQKEGPALKASLILLVTDYSSVIWAVCGNARMYFFRDQEFSFRSQDQSKVEQLIESDNLSAYGMQADEQHSLTNYLGYESGFTPFISEKYPLQERDVILLCNSGFWGNVRYDEMNRVLKTAQEPNELVARLEQLIKQKQTKLLSNYVVGAVFANRVLDQPSQRNNHSDLTKFLVASLALLLLVVGGIWTHRRMETARLLKEAEAEKALLITQQQVVTSCETAGDELARAGNFLDAAAEYNKALNVLSTYSDSFKMETIRQKHQFTLLVNEGDDHVKNKNYRAALDRYQMAYQMEIADLFKAGLGEKIRRVKSKTASAVAKAPQSAVGKRTGSVRYNYKVTEQNNLNQSNGLGNSSQVANKNGPVASGGFWETKEKRAELVSAESQARQLVKSGDELVASEQFKDATKAYKTAIKLYNKAGMTAKAEVVKEKLKEARRQMRRRFVGAH